MTTKQKVMKAVQALRDDASFEDAMERLLFLAKVEKGIQQVDTGRTIPHEKVKKMMKKWLKSGGLLRQRRTLIQSSNSSPKTLLSTPTFSS